MVSGCLCSQFALRCLRVYVPQTSDYNVVSHCCTDIAVLDLYHMSAHVVTPCSHFSQVKMMYRLDCGPDEIQLYEFITSCVLGQESFYIIPKALRDKLSLTQVSDEDIGCVEWEYSTLSNVRNNQHHPDANDNGLRYSIKYLRI